ncbi:MAG: T9SS type A sorting domain-containing protein [bacterium]
MMLFRLFHIFLTPVFFTLFLHAQYVEEEQGYLKAPKQTSHGIIFTDNAHSVLYLNQNDQTETLISSPGVGLYYTLSPDGREVGVKIIDSDGRQAPAVIDVETGIITMLASPGPRLGQTSITNDGRYAFTVGEDLSVYDHGVVRKYRIGYYSNIAPISPNGEFVAYNDGNDQLWMMELSSGKRSRLSDGAAGYFNPQWSPDGTKLLYSSLNGAGIVFDLSTHQSHSLGEAHSPGWSSDSRQIIFYRKEIQNFTLINSDIYAALYDGSRIERLTTTPNTCEMDPSFVGRDQRILFHTYKYKTLCSAEPSPHQGEASVQVILSSTEIPSVLAKGSTTGTSTRLVKTQGVTGLNIPYVHQTYDTPDWHNGNSSCAPTAAIMVLAYYNILPPWETKCSTPSLHMNNWGNYVADKFQFRQVNYANYTAGDASGKPAWGAYAYMWMNSRPHDRLPGFYRQMEMSSSLIDGVPHDIALSEVKSGRPYTICAMLTTSGHVVVAHGVGAEEHTFVYNDPYGNKNLTGYYKNYYGKDVQYDWPGYNNGFQNLVEVVYGVAAAYTQQASVDTVIDNNQFTSGFYLHAKAPASMTLWKDLLRGYGGHTWWKYSTASDTAYAQWTPKITSDGLYEVFAYIPDEFFARARYVVTASDGAHSVERDQSAYKDTWVSLGTYVFKSSAIQHVRLGDGSTQPGQPMAFDAIRFSYLGATTAIKENLHSPDKHWLAQNYPNPFNGSTTIQFQLSIPTFVRLKIVDLLGREVSTLVAEERGAGLHTVQWSSGNLQSGVYLLTMQAGKFREQRKLLLLR